MYCLRLLKIIDPRVEVLEDLVNFKRPDKLSKHCLKRRVEVLGK